MQVIKIEPGNSVLCDYCNEDFTDSKQSGGVLFGSYAVCPQCTPKLIADATAEGVLNRIKAECPPGQSFADWVRQDLR